jgi:hypothetical protein
MKLRPFIRLRDTEFEGHRHADFAVPLYDGQLSVTGSSVKNTIAFAHVALDWSHLGRFDGKMHG